MGKTSGGSLKYYLYFCVFEIVHQKSWGGVALRETLEKNRDAFYFREVLCLLHSYFNSPSHQYLFVFSYLTMNNFYPQERKRWYIASICVSLFPLVPSSLQVSTNLSSIFTQAQLGPCYFDRQVTCHQLWISLEVTLLLTRLNISDKKGGVLPALFLEKCKWSAKLRSETQEKLSNSPWPESTSLHRIDTFF